MSPTDFQSSIDEHNKEKQARAEKQAQIDAVTQSGDKVVNAVDNSTRSTAEGLSHVKGEVKVTNTDLAKSQDVNQVVEVLKKLQADLKPKELEPVIAALESVAKAVASLPQDHPTFPEAPAPLPFPSDFKVNNLNDLAPLFKEIVTVINKLPKTFNPNITVQSPEVNLETPNLDLNPIVEALATVKTAVEAIEQPDLNLAPVVEEVQTLTDVIRNLKFPVPNYVLPFRDANGKATQAQLDSEGNLSTWHFVNSPYDQIVPSGYDSYGIPSSILFKKNGVTINTLSITASSGNISNIIRS